ncbi:hypothetical protein [Streptomyces chartreusis]|uniref:hypothetical protein n=1 Tax=Streptomyces chartreusis TaxID=1969 RepID=UPI00380CCD73
MNPQPRPDALENVESASLRAALEQAATALAEATASMHAARRSVTATMLTAYRAGMPLHQIAEHADTTPLSLRNLLDAVGEPLRHRRSTGTPGNSETPTP